MRNTPAIARRALLAGAPAAILLSAAATTSCARASRMPKTEALLRLDAAFWQTVDRVNAGAWDTLPAAELHSAMASFTDLLLSMDDTAKATWSEPIHTADDVAARAVLAKHYSRPIGDPRSRLGSQDRDLSEQANRELIKAVPTLLKILSA